MITMQELKGKNVLITGASSGIGRAIGIEFAKYGANIAINYRKDKQGAIYTQREVGEYKTNSCIIQADVGIELDVINMVKKAIKELGSIDILINNAAIQIEIPTHERDVETFDRVISTNIRGPFICSREVLKHFLARKYPGVIINISSPHEIIPKPGYVDYAISKGGMKNFTQTLALEYSHLGIRVNAVAPGAVETRMNESWMNDNNKRAEVEKLIPLGWVAKPEDISPSVVFLASDKAKYITGATLFVDGGAVLYPERRTNSGS